MTGEGRGVRRRWSFRAGEALVGWLLVRMARLARRDGDVHELLHIRDQLYAGDSSDCGPNCPLRVAVYARGGER